MAAWAVIAVPLLIMFFALGMERVETRLRQVAVGQNDVEEFLEQARPNELVELFRHGFGRALELFRLRRTPPPRTPPPRTLPRWTPPQRSPLAAAPAEPGTDPGDFPTTPINLRAETVPIRRSRAS